jgi:hypothetical protein
VWYQFIVIVHLRLLKFTHSHTAHIAAHIKTAHLIADNDFTTTLSPPREKSHADIIIEQARAHAISKGQDPDKAVVRTDISFLMPAKK